MTTYPRALLLALVPLLSATALAQAPKALLVHHDDCAGPIRAGILATGQFAGVDLFDAGDATPSLALLGQYDAVLTWSSIIYSDPVALGDVLADYVDSGGGVVVALFGIYTLEGRWSDDTYYALPSTTQFKGHDGPHYLGTVNDPAHPVMNGVSALDGGAGSFRPSTTAVAPGSTVLAAWDDGIPLVAVPPIPGRVDLGFYPAKKGCATYSGWSTGAGYRLMANALLYAAEGGYAARYCTPESGSNHNTAHIDVNGNNLSGVVEVTLSNGPAGQPTYLLIGDGNQTVSQPPGAEGDLCILGGACLGRYAKDVGTIDVSGLFSTDISNSLSGGPGFGVPQCGGTILAGETWYFQYWHRRSMGQPTSFSAALSVTFED